MRFSPDLCELSLNFFILTELLPQDLCILISQDKNPYIIQEWRDILSDSHLTRFLFSLQLLLPAGCRGIDHLLQWQPLCPVPRLCVLLPGQPWGASETKRMANERCSQTICQLQFSKSRCLGALVHLRRSPSLSGDIIRSQSECQHRCLDKSRLKKIIPVTHWLTLHNHRELPKIGHRHTGSRPPSSWHSQLLPQTSGGRRAPRRQCWGSLGGRCSCLPAQAPVSSGTRGTASRPAPGESRERKGKSEHLWPQSCHTKALWVAWSIPVPEAKSASVKFGEDRICFDSSRNISLAKWLVLKDFSPRVTFIKLVRKKWCLLLRRRKIPGGWVLSDSKCLQDFYTPTPSTQPPISTWYNECS